MSFRRNHELRAARNEDLFRRINERLHSLTQIDRRAGPAMENDVERFVCECAQTNCSRVLELTTDEYVAVRAVNRRFVVFPDDSHTSRELEDVVERHDGYWIVQKHGEAGREADSLVDRS